MFPQPPQPARRMSLQQRRLSLQRALKRRRSRTRRGSSASAGHLQRRRRLVTRPRISRPDPVKRPPPPAPPPRQSRARLGLRWLLAERRRNKRSGVPAAGFRRFSAEDLAEFGREIFNDI